MVSDRINCLCFSVTKLDQLEYIPKGNQLPNYQQFVDDVLGKERVKQLFELWKFTYKLIGHERDDRKGFDHELGTILISCKLWKNSFSHGLKYGCLTVTTYQNNSIPNLYEISVAWPQYSTNPLDYIKQNEGQE